MARIGREQPIKVAVVGFWGVESVKSLLLSIMFTKCHAELIQRIDPLPQVNKRSLASDFIHQLVDIFELLECGPAGVARAPVRARLEPHRKRLGEIFVRMTLRVPEPKVLNETS